MNSERTADPVAPIDAGAGRVDSPRRDRLWVVLAGAMLLMGLVFFADAMLVARLEGQSPRVGSAALRALARWGSWALLAPLVVWLARRHSPDRWGRARALGVQVGLAAGVVALQLAVSAALVIPTVRGLAEAPPMPRLAVLYVSSQLQLSLLVYAAMVAAVWAWDGRRRLERRRRREEALERELVEARLRALRHHLRPHFLFNTLQATSELVREDPDGAVRVVTLLGDLLRSTLDAGDSATIPLRAELELLEPYLAIERIRFSDRLTVEVEVEDAVEDAPVPEFLLQPLVENAIRHGVGSRAGPGTIRVSARRDGGVVVIRVEDDGAGPDPDVADGVGLGTTRERLATLYGDAASLRLSARPDSGTVAEARIPVEPGPETEAPGG